MAEPNNSSTPTTGPTSNLPSYFNKLSQIYPRQTGNATLNLFASIVDHLAPISASSVIHDNASGPGTATSFILKNLKPEDYPTIVATDMVPAMIDAFNSDVAKATGSSKLTGLVMKSETLNFPDEHFTHSITNFSIFNFTDPLICVKEIYRTLKPSGQAFITTWKTFAIGNVIHETQRRIRPDLPPMKVSGAEYHKSDAVLDIMVKAGFAKENIQLLSSVVVVTSNDLEGLTEFGCGPFTDAARAGWTDEEKGRWKEVLLEVLEENKKESGGLKFEGWALLATK
ncbi:S-adenosyl-L-methionine-dependent methyltransferase [Rhexocercosporidium sp. MPI-PUGE-AT-0058]|nr:S-adenosyl-L-methionine-dependent methyltransferase [Rhexocercosporidium sp. MPI-PUGE-AT-0058]